MPNNEYFEIASNKYALAVAERLASQMLEIIRKVKLGEGWNDATFDLGNRLELFRQKCKKECEVEDERRI